MEKPKKPKLFLEFIGLPGSGKTAIAREVFEELKEKGYRCGKRASLFSEQESRQLGRYIYALYFIFRYPLKVKKLLYLCLKLRKTNKFFCLLKAFVSQHRAINSKKHEIVIYDQGVINAFLYLGQDKKDGFFYFMQLYNSIFGIIPTGLISLEVSFKEAMARARSRERKDHFTEKLESKEVENIFQIYNSNLAKLLPYVLSKKSVHLINIDGKEGISENSQKIVKFVEKFLSNAR